MARETRKIRGDLGHDALLLKTKARLGYSESVDYREWRRELKEELFRALGLYEIEKNACESQADIEWSEKREGYTVTRFSFLSEPEERVPCYLLIPDTGKDKYPVAITLQGHTTGFHLSVGEAKYEGDEKMLPREEIALQAVRHGYAALAIEQRGMGERRSPRSYGESNIPYPRAHMCAVPAMTAIALGRTLLGERVFDISRAIDLLEGFSQCDTEKILITGCSGGGTASFYAACCDERIGLSVPTCSFCSYRDSIYSIEHCACNYIPDAAGRFEMQDLSALIAPRSLTVVTGREDDIFPVEGVRNSYADVEKIFRRAGVPDSCRLVETPRGHYWCEDIVWEAIDTECERLGWK